MELDSRLFLDRKIPVYILTCINKTDHSNTYQLQISLCCWSLGVSVIANGRSALAFPTPPSSLRPIHHHNILAMTMSSVKLQRTKYAASCPQHLFDTHHDSLDNILSIFKFTHTQNYIPADHQEPATATSSPQHS